MWLQVSEYRKALEDEIGGITWDRDLRGKIM